MVDAPFSAKAAGDLVATDGDVKSLRWRYLADEAVSEINNDSFGIHSAYAKLLLQVAETSSTPFSIALYGGWGSGKTSVARMLQSLAHASASLSVIYLDVWKYSSDPLKRWILFETSAQLEQQHLLTNYRFENRSLQSHLEFDEQTEDSSRIVIDFKALGLLLTLLIVLIALSVILALYNGWSANPVILGLIVVIGGSAALMTIVALSFNELFKAIASLVFRRIVRYTTAKPAFSSEKFSQIFKNLVEAVTGASGRRILFIFDNLDRCPEEVAVDAIGVIKTYLDEPNCVYLIPCDEDALIRHIKKLLCLATGFGPFVAISFGPPFGVIR
jgi:hypothetical protein